MASDRSEAQSAAQSAVPSVTASDAGADTPESDWGDDAVLVWDGEYGDDGDGEIDIDDDGEHSDGVGNASEDGSEELLDEEDEEVNDIEIVTDGEESPATMPDYATWDVARLQRLLKDYGYRVSKDKKALVKTAETCWHALHPNAVPDPVTIKPRGKGKGKAAAKPRGVGRSNTRHDSGADDTENNLTEPDVDLDNLFHNMLKNDESLYLRLLRYEPLPFTELVSRAIATGVTGRGWQPRLKRFLDLQGIIYYTSDPTAPRRRY